MLLPIRGDDSESSVKTFLFLVVSLASILLLAACGGEAAPTPTPTPTPAATGALGHIAFRAYVDGNADIYVINADGSNQTRLTDDQEFSTMPRWSPDGSKIAFVSNRLGQITAIYVMDADGSNQTLLTHFPAPPATVNRPLCCPAWSPAR